MARAQLYTFKDLTEHARDYLGANASGSAGRDCRRAALTALRALASNSRWTYYFDIWRVVTNAPYSTGTVVYDHTGGAYERVVTLTGGTWPAWAPLGRIAINSIKYDIAARKSATELTLSVNNNPGEDVASTTFTLDRDTYPLPVDFLSLGVVTLANRATLLGFEHPSQWLERQQLYRTPSIPRTYTIRSDPNYQNTLAVSFFPSPDQAYSVDAVYQRTARQLNIEEYADGTVTTGIGSATVTGSGTAWTSRMAGSVFRVTDSRTDIPTGRDGDNPPLYERVIASVESATSLTLDDVIDETLTAVKYSISDPVDVETSAMLTALLRGVESQLGKSRRMADRDELEAEYNRALILAREADSRSFQDARAGEFLSYRMRMADMPMGPDA
jgi:hypothetical protein